MWCWYWATSIVTETVELSQQNSWNRAQSVVVQHVDCQVSFWRLQEVAAWVRQSLEMAHMMEDVDCKCTGRTCSYGTGRTCGQAMSNWTFGMIQEFASRAIDFKCWICRNAHPPLLRRSVVETAPFLMKTPVAVAYGLVWGAPVSEWLLETWTKWKKSVRIIRVHGPHPCSRGA